jgi:hypothetical protein
VNKKPEGYNVRRLSLPSRTGATPSPGTVLAARTVSKPQPPATIEKTSPTSAAFLTFDLCSSGRLLPFLTDQQIDAGAVYGFQHRFFLQLLRAPDLRNLSSG